MAFLMSVSTIKFDATRDLRKKGSASLYRSVTEAQGCETTHHSHRHGEPLVPA